MDVLKLARRLVETPTAKLLQKAIDKPRIKALIIELNTEVQLGQLHEDSNGVKLASNDPFGGYSINTQRVKGVGKTDVDLKDTMQYWRSYRVVTLNSGDYVIDSNPTIHGNDLEARWGNEIEGLNTENARIANKEIEKEVVKDLLRS
jgi:hypothetical protein